MKNREMLSAGYVYPVLRKRRLAAIMMLEVLCKTFRDKSSELYGRLYAVKGAQNGLAVRIGGGRIPSAGAKFRAGLSFHDTAAVPD